MRWLLIGWKFKMKKYKYTTTFNFEVKACEEIAGINLSQANIENLRSLIPTSVDLKKNIVLMKLIRNIF